jgi:long-chain acyl-CoA synthetase
MNLIDFLRKNVENYGDKVAVIDKSREITFYQLYEEVKKFSNNLDILNQEEIISLISENSISFIIAYLGIINSGKIVHLISPDISEINLFNQLKSSKSKNIICNQLTKNKISNFNSIKATIFDIEEILFKKYNKKIKFDVNEYAYLIYTSGTTSEPKGVIISHSMIEFTTKNIVKVLDYSNSDVDLLPLPLNHSFGLGCLHTSLYVGSTLVLLKNASNLEEMLDSLKKYKITTLAAIPATLTKILIFENKKMEDYFSEIRLIITNSTAIPKKTVIQFKEILKKGNLATYYGLTEASRSTFMIFDKNNHREESVGKCSPNVEIKIVNKEKNNLKLGDIFIKGENVIKKYWNNVEANKNIFESWLKTGDTGYFDEGGYLFLNGRSDEIINVGGEKVTPNEIEETIKNIPGVEDVVAFGIEHEIFGQTIKLNVIKSKNSDIDKAQILSYCIKNLEKFKIPSKIDFVQNIPKTDYGKVKRFMLK